MDIQAKRKHVKNTLYQINTITRIMIPITALMVVIGIITTNVVLTIVMFAIATILFIMCANVSYKIFLIFDNIHDDEVVERVYDIVCK